jgi:hypothetical protein
MRTYLLQVVIFFLTGLTWSSCQRNIQSTPRPGEMPGPRCIVYKTRLDYFDKVPVILSGDKNRVVSFPDPRDLLSDGKLTYPDRLEEEYLLDNRGIGPGVAFLKLTYQAYAALPAAPTVAELMNMVLDPDPLTEMYDLGIRSRMNSPAAEINAIISEGKLHEAKRLK